MGNFKCLPAKQEHIDALKGKMRAIDELECDYMLGKSADEALQLSYNMSDLVWALLKSDTVYCILGAAEFSPRVGAPWLLASDEIYKSKTFTLRVCKPLLKKLIDRYNYLLNYVHCKNIISINWLKWMGFHIDFPLPYGYKEELFHRFWMVKGEIYV